MDPAAFRASLVRIGISIPAAAYIVAPAGQGILFEDLVDLANENVSTLCSAIHHPGGMVNNAAGNPTIQQNPGIPVSALAERSLKIVIYVDRLYSRRASTAS